MNHQSFEDVPDDIIRYIIGYIPQIHLISFMRVNKRLNKLVTNVCDTISTDNFINACKNSNILTILRHYREIDHRDFRKGYILMCIYNHHQTDDHLCLIEYILNKKIYKIWDTDLSFYIKSGCHAAAEGSNLYLVKYFKNKSLLYDDCFIEWNSILWSASKNIENYEENNFIKNDDIYETVKYILINGGEDVNEYCVLFSCLSNNSRILELLLSHRSYSIESINRLMNNACHNDCLESLKVLIDFGATDYTQSFELLCRYQKDKLYKYIDIFSSNGIDVKKYM